MFILDKPNIKYCQSVRENEMFNLDVSKMEFHFQLNLYHNDVVM